MSSKAPIMLGTELPDIDVWSERVAVALGQNPGAFTGPGTNTYLVGTGRKRILLDTGDGRDPYLPILEQALERLGCDGIQEIVLTHGHPDHIGGVAQVMSRFGEMPVHKLPHAGFDANYPVEITAMSDGDTIETEGARLRAIHTPGHSEDHLCFLLEEERALFSGDNVLGIGTTVIPHRGGSLTDYMSSLERLRAEDPGRIYPAHGPCIEDGGAKIREYIAHRNERELQILSAMGEGASRVPEIVRIVYAAYPESLHAAAGQSVTSHLVKLEDEGRVHRDGEAADALTARWTAA